MTKTIVKTLTGELVVIEHYGEEDLKLEVNKKFPELYCECQTIVYNEDNAEECYVIVDAIEDVIEINLTYSPLPFYITTKKELIEDYSQTKFLNEYKKIKKHHLFTSSDTYDDFPLHHIIKAKLIHMKWHNKNDNKGYRIYKDSFIYHPKYGFTTEEFMQTEHIKNNKFMFNIPSDEYVEYSTYWFETLKDMMKFMKDKGMRLYTPYIFNSDDFLTKVKNKLDN